MKWFIKLFFWILLNCLLNQVLAQDSVFVDLHKNSYLVFPQPVSLVDMGSQGDYLHQVVDNVVLLKALQKGKPTTLFVKAGNQVQVAILCYKAGNDKHLYDYCDTKNIRVSDDRPSVANLDVIEKQVAIFKKQPDQSIRRRRQNHLVFRLLNLKTDEYAIYLKLRLENNSALIYQTESLTAENLEFQRKRFLSRKKVNRIPVNPIVPVRLYAVPANQSREFFLVLPVYAVGTQGALHITLHESSGVRTMTLKLTDKHLSKAKLLNHGKD